ncbi:MAG: VIT1/CCC1 transporter family protein [Candidatus Dormiibacterota bacterium]
MVEPSEATSHIDTTRSRVERRSHVREIVFGTQDGLLTSLGLVSGVSGATTGRIWVLIAGFAGGVAGMLAMGAGAYIAAKSQRDVQQEELRHESSELEGHPKREMDELVELFLKDGLDETDAQMVARVIAKHPEAMLTAMAQKELGFAVAGGRPFLDGVVIAIAFLIGAAIPIVPWFAAPVTTIVAIGPFAPSPALLMSVTATAVALFLIGVGKGRLAGGHSIRSGVEITAIGLGCALIAFLLGTVVPDAFGLHPLSTG